VANNLLQKPMNFADTLVHVRFIPHAVV
jgi:hypothetical protein